MHLVVIISLSVFLSPAMALYDPFSSPATPWGGRHQEIPSSVALLLPHPKICILFSQQDQAMGNRPALGRSPWTLP